MPYKCSIEYVQKETIACTKVILTALGIIEGQISDLLYSYYI